MFLNENEQKRVEIGWENLHYLIAYWKFSIRV